MDTASKAFLIMIISVIGVSILIYDVSNGQYLKHQSALDDIALKTNLTTNMTDKEKMAIIDEKCELYMRGSQSCKYDLYERLITGGRR